jgi:hypothetical protein
MKINEKLTQCSIEIKELLQKKEMHGTEIFDLLSTLNVKFFLTNFQNDKDLFIEIMESMYDDLEEQANAWGMLGE